MRSRPVVRHEIGISKDGSIPGRAVANVLGSVFEELYPTCGLSSNTEGDRS